MPISTFKQPLFGTLFKQERLHRQLTIIDCANEIGVGGNTVYRWETGDGEPHERLRPKIKEWFDSAPASHKTIAERLMLSSLPSELMATELISRGWNVSFKQTS